MTATVAGDHEALREQQHILLYSEPSSPLQQSETAVDKLLLMAANKLPIVHAPAPLMGCTGPITMASGLTLALSELAEDTGAHYLDLLELMRAVDWEPFFLSCDGHWSAAGHAFAADHIAAFGRAKGLYP